MSNCRRMSHMDAGAPVMYGYKRGSLYEFLDTVFLTGYNEKFVTGYTRVDREVILQYAAPHGYVEGQLIELSGSSFPAFNINYRVTEVPSSNILKIYIKDASFASYPESSSEPTLKTKVAPLGWEKVYGSPTQRSYRSRATKSSKVVVTFKQPTYSPTIFVTTSAHCYEMDISKDIDPLSGSTIDSCLASQKATSGHSAQYFVISTQSDNLAATPAAWDHPTHRVAWTIVGDEKMVYIVNTPYVDSIYENGTYRQYNIDFQTSCYRQSKMTAFGDIEAIDEAEYLTGSSFYFNFYYFLTTSQLAGNIANSAQNPFIRPGSWSWYNYFFTAYDPTGTIASARIQTIGGMGVGSYGNCSASQDNYIAYPQRITGGLTYYDYLAYANGTAIANTNSIFLKGFFKYIKYTDCNITNLGNARANYNRVLAQEKPYKKLYFINNHSDYWHYNSYQGSYLVELD